LQPHHPVDGGHDDVIARDCGLSCHSAAGSKR
jgi:hypothetical protein